LNNTSLKQKKGGGLLYKAWLCGNKVQALLHEDDLEDIRGGRPTLSQAFAEYV